MKFKYLLIFTLLVASLQAAFVTDLTFTLNGDGYTVSGCDYSAQGSLDIPSTYNGLSVTSIGIQAFYGCSGLTIITIPNSVASIPIQAFYGCSGLTSIMIPGSVTSIGSSAFYNCSGLTSITIPNSVTSIGDYAFSNCTSLSSISIPTLCLSLHSLPLISTLA